MTYNPQKIEAKWQEYWLKNKIFKAEIDPKKAKFYCLDMFPYPSGNGLHVGHPEGYTATDIYCRYKRMKGFNVLHTMGWDAFGLPAEQYAVKTGVHPTKTTEKNIATFKKQIQALGFSYDWDREINTTDPDYYKWTQWIFLKIFEKGLAYQEEAPVNWCPELKAVLSHEEVADGLSVEGGHPVYQKNLRQWKLKITAYAEALLKDLEGLDWPEPLFFGDCMSSIYRRLNHSVLSLLVLKSTSISAKCFLAHLILCSSLGLKFSKSATNFVSLTKYSFFALSPSCQTIAQSGL